VTRNTAAIGDFLKVRRRQLARAELGLPAIGGKRGAGLSREEVAYLAGVSVTWYTWLEQGRDIRPSRQVLDALSRAFRLTAAQQAYLLSLAGYSARRPAAELVPLTVPAHIQRLLDVLVGFPAFAITPDWGIAAWNSAFAWLYPNVATVAESDRNLLWLLFTDPYLRDLLPDWDRTTRSNVAAFRAEVGPRIDDAPFAHLVKRLRETSEAFREMWQGHPIAVLTSRRRLFRHPVVGDLHVEQHSLKPSDGPDLHLVIYRPIGTADTPPQLQQLRDKEPWLPT